MNTLEASVKSAGPERGAESTGAPQSEQPAAGGKAIAWPEEWLLSGYEEALAKVAQAFDSEYFPRKYMEAGEKIGKAAELAKVDRKTFRAHLKNCGLESLPPEDRDDA